MSTNMIDIVDRVRRLRCVRGYVPYFSGTTLFLRERHTKDVKAFKVATSNGKPVIFVEGTSEKFSLGNDDEALEEFIGKKLQ